jgi:hypothetical protein
VAGRAEDVLAVVAGEQAPRVRLGGGDKERRACRAAWEAWWKARHDRLDLARVDADAMTYSPTRRAAAVARQFLDALLGGDRASARRAVDLPFSVVGMKQMEKGEDLEQWVDEVHGRAVERKLTCRVRSCIPGEEYARTAGDLPGGAPGLEHRWRDMCFVYAHVHAGGKAEADEGIYVLVRVSGGPVRVVGVGSGWSPGDKRDKAPRR